ncbi:MAG: HD domain-containing protein [Steroidobacteraceae bacterium]
MATSLHRRYLLKLAGAAALVARLGTAAERDPAVKLPNEVAGIALPHSELATAAAAFSRHNCPDYLFNHCLRTYLFGALLLRQQQRDFNADSAFVAAALHDLGLLPAFESPKKSFEIDGADRAEKFMLDRQQSAAAADQVWHAVEMHDGKWALTARQGPEAMLVALGAGTDVDGPDPGQLEQRQIAEVLAAFPRLQFKRRFTELLIEHCGRKPTSQRGTWLEGVCRRHAAGADDTVEQDIANAAFPE